MLDPFREAIRDNVCYGQHGDKATVGNSYKATFRRFRIRRDGDMSSIFRLWGPEHGDRGFQGSIL
jgi:hypothetical protein